MLEDNGIGNIFSMFNSLSSDASLCLFYFQMFMVRMSLLIYRKNLVRNDKNIIESNKSVCPSLRRQWAGARALEIPVVHS